MATVSVSKSVAIPHAHAHGRLRRGGDATVSSGNAFTLPDTQYHFPTPPNSISPSLPPVQKKQKLADSDVDVSDIGVERDNEGNGDGAGGLHLVAEAAGAITPRLLAKYHLPGILLQHGPLAIRHLTAHLISSIPGFSSIPPAKQRRLVVGALEGRGGVCGNGAGEVGGIAGDVVFEKVGWGRWDARIKGDPAREVGTVSSDSSESLPYDTKPFRAGGLLSGAGSGRALPMSYTGESGIFVQSEEEGPTDLDSDSGMEGEEEEDEVDRMSLDETSDGEEEEAYCDDDDADMTDEEDWAQMGAAMLRGQAGSPVTSDGCANCPSTTTVTPSYANPAWTGLKRSGDEDPRAREEREAVEALVKLSSV